MKNVAVKNVIFGKDELGLIAGPCVIESLDHALFMAESLKKVSSQAGINMIYKSSFDKANRSSISSYRGLGIEEGLSILQKLNQRLACQSLLIFTNQFKLQLSLKLLMLFKFLHFCVDRQTSYQRQLRLEKLLM